MILGTACSMGSGRAHSECMSSALKFAAGRMIVQTQLELATRTGRPEVPVLLSASCGRLHMRTKATNDISHQFLIRVRKDAFRRRPQPAPFDSSSSQYERVASCPLKPVPTGDPRHKLKFDSHREPTSLLCWHRLRSDCFCMFMTLLPS